jgi:hypothetical protein
VERVVKVELDPASKQADLVAAITPVADRLLRSYKEAQARLQAATAKDDEKGIKDAKDEMSQKDAGEKPRPLAVLDPAEERSILQDRAGKAAARRISASLAQFIGAG